MKLSLTEPTQQGHKIHEIDDKPQAKLLGVILDSKLTWAAQHEKVRGTATKFTAAFKRYTKAASGIRPAEALKLYNAVAVPRICYASDVWYKPPHKTAKGARQQGAVRLTKQLESIQRQAAIAITGALRTTAGDVATVHANIKPIALQLKETGLKTYARYASRPTSHPLYKSIQKTAKRSVLHHRTALHQLAEASNFKVGETETIDTTRAPPSEATSQLPNRRKQRSIDKMG